jgi:hypothetical protein
VIECSLIDLISLSGIRVFDFAGIRLSETVFFCKKSSTSSDVRMYVQCTEKNPFGGNGGKSENRPKLRRWDFGWVHTVVLHYVASL